MLPIVLGQGAVHVTHRPPRPAFLEKPQERVQNVRSESRELISEPLTVRFQRLGGFSLVGQAGIPGDLERLVIEIDDRKRFRDDPESPCGIGIDLPFPVEPRTEGDGAGGQQAGQVEGAPLRAPNKTVGAV
jgi:hypothetical protein